MFDCHNVVKHCLRSPSMFVELDFHSVVKLSKTPLIFGTNVLP